MHTSIKSRFAVLIVALFSVMVAFAGPSTYKENAKKQTGKLVVAQFNYPGHTTLSARMVTASGSQLQVGTVLDVTKVKRVRSKFAVPGNYDAVSKTLLIPALIVKSKSGWTYYDVTLVANSGNLDGIGFPTDLIVTSMAATRIGEASAGPQGTAGADGATGPVGPRVLRVRLARLVPRVLRVLMARQARLVPRVLRVLMVRLARLVRKVLRVLTARQVPLVRKAPPVLMAQLARLVHKAPLVRKVLPAIQACQV